MRLFHSFWSKPALKSIRWGISNQLETNIWLYTLSVLYAKKTGVELVLHTDSLGKELLGHLPYDEIYLTLEAIPNDIPIECWTYGKIVSNLREPLGSIQIDCDVFIKSSKTLEALKYSSYDLIVQNREGLFDYDYSESILKSLNILKKNELNSEYAVSCGVVGFNNNALLTNYSKKYFEYIDKIKSNLTIKKYFNKPNFCVNLPLEQHLLASLSQDYKVKSLLEYPNKSLNEVAKEIDYQHLYSSCKYDYKERIKFIVFMLDKDLYYKTKQILNV